MWVSLGYADQRTVALTIDDLPFVGESKNFHLEISTCQCPIDHKLLKVFQPFRICQVKIPTR